MIKILFVCHGNICRSPMAEFVLKDMARKQSIADRLYIDSAATSTEEIGNGVHRGTRNKLRETGVPMEEHRARQITRSDYDKYDLLIGMDRWNIQNMKKILGEGDKIHRLLEFTKRGGDIADPWYTGDFDVTYNDICEGCEGLLEYLRQNSLL